MTLEKVHKDALARFKQAEEYERDDRRLMEEDLSFASGDQWPLDIQNERRRTDRPYLTFNRLPAFIEQVVGDARQNKPAIKVHPVDDGADEDIAEIYEGLIRDIESRCRASDAYITGLAHATAGSRGAWRILTEYTSDDAFDQDIVIRRIANPFAVFWDPGAKEYDKSDANWCFVSEWVTKEYFELKYPDKTPDDWPAEYRRFRSYDNWLSDNRVRIAEYWVKKPVSKEIYQLSNGMVVEELLPDLLAPDEVSSALSGMPYVVRSRKVKSHKVVRYVLSGHCVLEGPQDFPSRYIPVVPCFGPEEFVGDQIRYRSLIRYAKDPQRMYNYWQTAIAEKIALAPKSPWLATVKQLAGLEQIWAKANKENRPYLPYNPDPEALGPPQRQEPAYVNAAEIQQSQQAVEDLKATMGIFDASLGAQGNETSGRAIIARQREGDTATFAWIDNLSRSIQHTGRILIDMIPRVYDTQRVVRVLGEDDSIQMMPINYLDGDRVMNDLTVGKYDVRISVGPSYQTKRLEAADSLLQFVQALPQAGQVAGDLIAKSMDWPGADEIAERLRAMLPPGIVEDDESDPRAMVGQLMQELEALGEQARTMAEELERHEEAEVELKEAQAEAQRARALRDKVEAESQQIENDAVRNGLISMGIE